MEKKKKICKGSYKVNHFAGCSEDKYIHKFGLCKSCFIDWCFNTDDGQAYYSNQFIPAGNKKVKSEEKKEARKEKTTSGNFNIYKTTAWKWCSRFVLLNYADDSGIVRCATSPNLSYHVTDRDIHCGHFIKTMDGTKSHHSVAFDFRNLGPQSSVDNVRFNGKPEIMKEWLISMHGQAEIDDLIIKSNEVCKLTQYDLDEIAKTYRILFNNLLKERNINNPWK